MHPLGGQIGGADVNQNSVGMGVGAALLSQNDRKSNKALDAPECFHTGKPLPARAGGASPARPAPAEPLHAARLFRLRPPRPAARRSRVSKRFNLCLFADGLRNLKPRPALLSQALRLTRGRISLPRSTESVEARIDNRLLSVRLVTEMARLAEAWPLVGKNS